MFKFENPKKIQNQKLFKFENCSNPKIVQILKCSNHKKIVQNFKMVIFFNQKGNRKKKNKKP
jgi:hypothetical protein